MAAETVEYLSMRIDVKTGRLFFMKWAKCDEIGARSLERKIGADDIDDVIGVADTFAGVV